MIDVGSAYLGNPVVETTGFKMIDVSQALIVSSRFRTARNLTNFLNLMTNLTNLNNRLILKLKSLSV